MPIPKLTMYVLHLRLHKWNYGPVLLWTAAANFQILSQASHINLEMSVIQFEISQENGVHCLLQIDYELGI